VTGLGGDLGFRDGLDKNGEDLGMLFQVAHKHKLQDFVDIAAYEESMNPDAPAEMDSNPQSVLSLKGRRIVADAGGNSLLDVDHEGNISTIAVFPERISPLPFGPPLFQSVPTSVVQGPDGALYASELTGFPFPVGEARVYRIDPCAGVKVFESGFTNIIAIDFDDQGRLLVLEIATNGLLSGDPTGALIRVNHDGTKDELAIDGLFMPTGLAVGPKGGIYVSNCGVCAGDGEVIRIKP
jgi:sugar lactone lactonase YvrE